MNVMVFPSGDQSNGHCRSLLSMSLSATPLPSADFMKRFFASPSPEA